MLPWFNRFGVQLLVHNNTHDLIVYFKKSSFKNVSLLHQNAYYFLVVSKYLKYFKNKEITQKICRCS